ncbi:MAG: SDR family oxidoreductase [Pyrobaculum arsenaticum]|nr:SDR family oxidoreductase [Pyrobaculum arsenaticum]MCY0889588.1 SDR family oxidoreductase [Pyrobaculum arsenaticum]NYR14408.1 SDR family oxidoreductase [Pyrobaculum arsenaticum]
MRLVQKNVVVVGVGPGLGSAVAYMALREAASVYAFARRPEALAGLQWLAQHGKVYLSARDFAKLDQALAAAEEARKVFPAVHGLVVTAGGYTSQPVEEVGEAELEDMLSKNLKAHIYAVRAFAPLLAPGSSVVLVSSVGGAYKAWPRHVAYVASKAAVAKAAEALAAELLERGVRVNAVAPGGMTKDFQPGRRYEVKLGAPQVPPEEVAKVVIWLLTDEARWVTGAVIPVDGGRRLL